MDTAATVKLATEDLVCLDEALKLASQVCVLSLQALGVLLEGVTLSQQVAVVCAVLCLSDAERFNVTSDGEKSVLLLLETEL